MRQLPFCGSVASLAKREATDQLALIIARLPGTGCLDQRRGEIAGNLIELLPSASRPRRAAGCQPRPYKPGYWTTLPERAKPALIALFVAALTAALVWFS
jgi:hypothetical protein